MNYQAKTTKFNEEKESSFGRLQDYLNRDNNFNRRVGQQAADSAATRGLGNSTIASSSGIAAVAEKLGQHAMKDSELYSVRTTENNRAVNEALKTNATNNTNLAITDKNNAASESRLLKELSSRETLQDKNNVAVNSRLLKEIAAKKELQRENNTALDSRLLTEITSKEKLASQQDNLERHKTEVQAYLTLKDLKSRDRNAQLEAETRLAAVELETKNRERIAQLDTASRERVEELRMQYEAQKYKDSRVASAWDYLQQGIAQIDTNAAKASQITQFNRLMDMFDNRMKFITGEPVGLPRISTGLSSHEIDEQELERWNKDRGKDYRG